MTFNVDRLAGELGVDPNVILDAQRLDPDAIAENVGQIAVDTAHTGNGRLDADDAVNTLLALQNTVWTRFEGSDRAQTALYHLAGLAALGLPNPYQVEGEQ